MTIILFIALVAYVALKTVFIETKHDYLVIRGFIGPQGGWKLYGAFVVATELIALCAFASVYTGVLRAFLLLKVLSVLYSIMHDCGVSYRLTGGLFHLGDGAWDLKVTKIFQHGIMWFVFKLIWLIIISGIYFKI